MDGFLAKLKILAFGTPKYEQGGPPVGLYLAMFNPQNFSMDHQVNYDRVQTPGSIGTENKFKNIEAQKIKFDILIDGTGASGEKREVWADVLLFKYTVGYLGEIHQPHYLVLSWGLLVFKCVLDSMDISYELFRPDGTPLRARITATFIEHTEGLLESLLADRSSPDLTHERTVTDGDTLPLMTYRIYGDSSYYLEVARVNGLDDFRKIKPGDKIIFPPLQTTSK
jgi:nucleoid-associated protein YgaU